MSQTTHPTFPLRRPGVAVALLIALAIAVATACVAAPGAKAATGSCDPGDFCMWYLTNYSGGLYEWSGSDSNLGNDHFENADSFATVTNNTESVHNYGVPATYDDVRAYDGTGYSGASTCYPRGARISDLGGWNNRISSYRWVTSC